jgi:hypothetical protein
MEPKGPLKLKSDQDSDDALPMFSNLKEVKSSTKSAVTIKACSLAGSQIAVKLENETVWVWTAIPSAQNAWNVQSGDEWPDSLHVVFRATQEEPEESKDFYSCKWTFEK